MQYYWPVCCFCSVLFGSYHKPKTQCAVEVKQPHRSEITGHFQICCFFNACGDLFVKAWVFIVVWCCQNLHYTILLQDWIL